MAHDALEFKQGQDSNGARDAVAFLRRKEKDAIEFAPSLYVGRGGRRREEDTDDQDQGEAAPPEATSAASKTNRAEPNTPIVIDNPKGLPIDNPFTSN